MSTMSSRIQQWSAQWKIYCLQKDEMELKIQMVSEMSRDVFWRKSCAIYHKFITVISCHDGSTIKRRTHVYPDLELHTIFCEPDPAGTRRLYAFK